MTENSFTIIYATDIHLGYTLGINRKETERDPFIAFQEIIDQVKEHNGDLLLLGGDLFHSPHPAMDHRISCRDILKSHVIGPKSKNAVNAIKYHKPKKGESLTNPNFMNPTMNVKIPIISIFGNHDEPLASGNCQSFETMRLIVKCKLFFDVHRTRRIINMSSKGDAFSSKNQNLSKILLFFRFQ